MARGRRRRAGLAGLMLGCGLALGPSLAAQAPSASPDPPAARAPHARGWTLAPYAALAGGATADLWTTQRALAAGGYEANPLMAHQAFSRVALFRVAAVAGTGFAMRYLETHGHHRIAHGIGYLSGAVGGLAAAHNAQVGHP